MKSPDEHHSFEKRNHLNIMSFVEHFHFCHTLNNHFVVSRIVETEQFRLFSNKEYHQYFQAMFRAGSKSAQILKRSARVFYVAPHFATRVVYPSLCANLSQIPVSYVFLKPSLLMCRCDLFSSDNSILPTLLSNATTMK